MTIQRNHLNAVIQCGARLVLMVAALSLPLPGLRQTVQAQGPGGGWTDFVNISRTATASTYPCIAADAAGNVHVLWSEDVGGDTKKLVFKQDGSPELDSRGQQLNHLTDSGDTLYYTRWNGQEWLDPVDININPFGIVQYPEAAVDPHGSLHLVWLAAAGSTASMYYSRALASKAESASAWSQPTMLAENIVVASSPVGIVADLTGGIHVIYSQLGTEAGTFVINSFDGGNTWSAPIQLYSTYDAFGREEGVSPLRLVIDGKDRLHATWTRYGKDGNGKAIFYSQSRDLGLTWSIPLEVATWQPGWYEVDWLSAGAVDDEIHLVWEGSNIIAYFNERISRDGGVTWSQPQRILPKIRGENGFADLVVDSANQLHMLWVQRGDASSLTNGIWYTSWNRDYWQDPILLGGSANDLYARLEQLSPSALEKLMRGTFTGTGLRYQRAAIVNGNQLFVVVVNEYDGDIWSSHTSLPAPYTRPQPYSGPAATPTLTPVPTSQPVATPTLTPLSSAGGTRGQLDTHAGDPLLIGVVPALLLIVGVLVYVRVSRRSRF